jgi:hypothetical protein
VFRAERQISRDAEQAATLSRLAARWRADAHEAIRCTIDGACILALADGREIHYVANSSEITREIRRGESVLHRDAFPLARDCTASFEVVEQPAQALVRLTIRPTGVARAGTTGARSATIEAALHVPAGLAGQERGL